MTVKCDHCPIIINGAAAASFVLMGRRVDLCKDCAQQLHDALFEVKEDKK